jgi:hypothetical protein
VPSSTHDALRAQVKAMGKMRSKNLLHFLSMICLSNEGQPIAHAQAFVAQNLWSYKREGNMKRFCWNNDLSDEMRLSVQVAPLQLRPRSLAMR